MSGAAVGGDGRDSQAGTGVILVYPTGTYKIKQFFEDKQGEKTPGISKDEKGAPGLSWTKSLMKIPWNSRNIGILAGLDIGVCWSAEQESESKFLHARNLWLTLCIETVIALAGVQITSCFLELFGGFWEKKKGKWKTLEFLNAVF